MITTGRGQILPADQLEPDQDHLHSQRFPPGKVPGGGRGGN